MLSICSVHLPSELNTIPRCLWKSICPTFKLGFPYRLLSNSMMSVLSGLSVISLSSLHFLMSERSELTMSCKFCRSLLVCPRDVSSAKSLHIPSVWSAMSLISIRNSMGPNTVPWGTPAYKQPTSDSVLFSTTFCFLSVR